MNVRIPIMALAFGLALNCGGSATGSDPGSLGLMLGLAGQQQTASGQADIVLRLNLPQTAASAAAGPVSRSGALATQVSDVTRVSIEITGTGIAAPITANLTQNGSVWTGTIPGIPVGADRSFVARAYNLADELLYEGQSTNVTIAFNQTAQLQIQMQESNPAAAFSNVAPYLQTFAMSGGEVRPGETISFSVTAIDDNAGDVLSFAWTADGGSFDDATSATPIWTAPASNGNYTITVHVSDPLGAQATMSVSALVDDGTGSGSVGIGFNNTPAVTSVTALPTRIDVNASTNISAIVTDADGDVLTYSWTSDCGGSFADATALSTTFTAPATYPASNQCTLTINVDDGNGGVNSGSLTINVRAPVTIDPIVVPDTQAPTLTGLTVDTTSVDTRSGNATASLTISLADDQKLPDDVYTYAAIGTFTSPNGTTQYAGFSASSYNESPGGTDTAKTYTTLVSFPQYSASGDWTLTSLSITDAVGNNVYLTTAQITALGFDTIITNTATVEDLTAPTLDSLTFSAATFDTTSGSASLTASITVSDNLQLPTGYLYTVQLSLIAPSGTQYASSSGSSFNVLPGSTATTQSFDMPLNFPQYAEAGIWTIGTLSLTDSVGNRVNLNSADLVAAGLPNSVENLATVSDTAAPTLTAFSIDTPVVNASSGIATVGLSLTVTDDFGLPTNQYIYDVTLTLISPSGVQFSGASASLLNEQSGSTPTNRSYATVAQIREGAETGDWTVASMHLVDGVGNQVTLTTADLTAAGFPTVVTVQ